MERLPKIGIPIIIAVVLGIIFISKSTITIDSGKAGVLYETFSGGVSVDDAPLDEGFHFIAPWNNVIVYEVRQQEVFEKMQVLLHKEKGKNYLQRIIQPAIRSAARSVVGRYTPEQLYSSKRDVIQKEIFEETKKIVTKQYIDLEEILVRDVTLPPTIKDAIERKLKQEQESLEYEFRLTKAAKEAQRQKIDAEGKAEANRILSASLTDKILQEKGIQATIELAKSPNSKVVVVGSAKDGLPLILGK